MDEKNKRGREEREGAGRGGKKNKKLTRETRLVLVGIEDAI